MLFSKCTSIKVECLLFCKYTGYCVKVHSQSLTSFIVSCSYNDPVEYKIALVLIYCIKTISSSILVFDTYIYALSHITSKFGFAKFVAQIGLN